MMRIALDDRLLSAAKFVRQGAIFADIGTDHAHLPIFLLKEGRISRAICSDINAEPLAKARENASAAGLLSKTEFYQTDGVRALSGLGITDYAICGMGGELIARIIEEAEELKNPAVRLILQPMSRQGELRRALARLGFSVLSESYSESRGKHYVCICAEFTGDEKEISDIQAGIGEYFPDNENLSSQISYLKAKKQAILRRIDGKKKSDISLDYDEALLRATEERLAIISMLK